jgi:glycosyltransferase involved in cell wall biosynthesis
VIEASQITVVHNGIDVERFDRSIDRAAAHILGPSAAHNATGSNLPMLVGTVGHLAPIKGHDVFVRAAALIRRAGSRAAQQRDVRFVIIGEDKSPQMEYRKSLERLVAELDLSGIVDLPGWRDDMPAMLAALTLFVSAARSEPFGLAIVEAMAAGLPIVATASEGASEIIEHGATGRLVPIDNRDALAEAIIDLLDVPAERSRLGHKAEQTARERYSLTRMARDTERVYREALAEST